MTNLTTLGDLKTKALDYADLRDTKFGEEALLVDYINDGLSELHDLLVNSGSEWKRKKQAYSIVSGTEEYALPSDFYRLLKLYYISSSRRWIVERISLDGLDGYRTSPISTGSLEMWYYPQFVKLKNDNDGVDSILPEGWENIAALHAGIMLLSKQESDPSLLVGMKGQLLQRIVQMAEPRDEGGGDCVSDVSGRWTSARDLSYFDDREFRYRVIADKLLVTEIEY